MSENALVLDLFVRGVRTVLERGIDLDALERDLVTLGAGGKNEQTVLRYATARVVRDAVSKTLSEGAPLLLSVPAIPLRQKRGAFSFEYRAAGVFGLPRTNRDEGTRVCETALVGDLPLCLDMRAGSEISQDLSRGNISKRLTPFKAYFGSTPRYVAVVCQHEILHRSMNINALREAGNLIVTPTTLAEFRSFTSSFAERHS